MSLEDILRLIGDRTSITADELKHISRMGMGACRGSRYAQSGTDPEELRHTGDLGTYPRGPMANLVQMGKCILPPETGNCMPEEEKRCRE